MKKIPLERNLYRHRYYHTYPLVQAAITMPGQVVSGQASGAGRLNELKASWQGRKRKEEGKNLRSECQNK